MNTWDYKCYIADSHGIPRGLAHTINLEKAAAYFRWCSSPVCRLEKWLDGLEAERKMRLRVRERTYG